MGFPSILTRWILLITGEHGLRIGVVAEVAPPPPSSPKRLDPVGGFASAPAGDGCSAGSPAGRFMSPASLRGATLSGSAPSPLTAGRAPASETEDLCEAVVTQ